MKIPKPSEADKDWFRSIVEDRPELEVKAMFGNLAGFVNGNMCCGLFGPDLGLRLDLEERQELLAVEGTGAFGPPERPMSEYVAVPRRWRDEGADEIDHWLSRAVDHAAALPVKKPKPKKAKQKKAKPKM